MRSDGLHVNALMGHPGYVSVRYLGSALLSLPPPRPPALACLGSFRKEHLIQLRGTREDSLEEGAFRWGFEESSSNGGSVSGLE